MLNFNFKNFKIVSVNKVSLSVNIVCTCDLHLWKREGSGGVLKLKNLLHVRRERKTGHCKTWPWLGFFNSMRLLEGRKNMHMWQAVVGIHELVTAFKTVKEETLFEELKVLPAGAVYMRSPLAQPLHIAIGAASLINLFWWSSSFTFCYRDIKDQQNSWTAVQDILYVSWMDSVKWKGQFTSQR